MTSVTSPRGKLSLSGLTVRNDTSTEPANSNQTLNEEANRLLAAMTGNTKRNEIMIEQIIKPHFAAGPAAPARMEAITKAIASIAEQQQLNAEEIVNLAIFTDRVLPGKALGVMPTRQMAA